MKYLVASDIHGSFYYASKVIEAYRKHECDKILLLGDILYHGPRNDLPKEYAPKKVIPLLNEYSKDIICCRGNCDAEVDQMVLDFDVMQDYQVISENDYQIIISHGHVYNPDNLPNVSNNDIFMFGHIHIPKAYKGNDCFIINPGSISIPKEDSKHSYGILEDKIFKLYDDNHDLLDTYNMQKDD